MHSSKNRKLICCSQLRCWWWVLAGIMSCSSYIIVHKGRYLRSPRPVSPVISPLSHCGKTQTAPLLLFTVRYMAVITLTEPFLQNAVFHLLFSFLFFFWSREEPSRTNCTSKGPPPLSPPPVIHRPSPPGISVFAEEKVNKA